jgi:hypothetical protein
MNNGPLHVVYLTHKNHPDELKVKEILRHKK